MRKTLQRVSAALMVPVVILPIGALFMAFGTQLGLAPVIAAGRAILLDYLPLLFAVGVTIGFTAYDGMAAFAAVIGYLVFTGALTAVNANLDMGVLGGILSGALTATLFVRFHAMRLPEYLGLFAGKRFIPVATAVLSLCMGSLLGLLWEPVQQAIFSFGNWIMGSGAAGLFFYGFTNRLLIPTGLHHIINNLILYTFGVYTEPSTGIIYQGEVQRFFAGDPTAGTFSAGFYMIIMFAIPAACLAMIHEAQPSQRKQTAGILVTAALTSLLTGITEPAEFTFMFAAPVLYALHSIFTGVASLLAHVFSIRHYGYALPMYLINWQFSQNALVIVPLGLAYAVIYYFGFRYAIKRFNLPTLGRAEERPRDHQNGSPLVETLMAALGGRRNVVAVDSCMTRLRLSVTDMEKIDEAQLKRLGAAGVSRIGSDYLQVVMGTQSQEIAEELRRIMDVPPPELEDSLVSPVNGAVVPLSEVGDDVFARGLMGVGLGIIPKANHSEVLSPCGGTIEKIFPGGHAIVLKDFRGTHILIHIGIGTVHLKGEGFASLTCKGAMVRAGDPLVAVDWKLLKSKGIDTTIVVTFMEATDWSFLEQGDVTGGLDIICRRKQR